MGTDWTVGEWLMPAEAPATKAAREDVVYYEVKSMPDDMDEDRRATIVVEWMTNINEELMDFQNNYTVRKEIIINQLNSIDVAVDKPMDKEGNLYPADKTETLCLKESLMVVGHSRIVLLSNMMMTILK